MSEPRFRLEVMVVAKPGEDGETPTLTLADMHALLHRELREESAWYRKHFKVGLTQWEKEATHRFMARKLLPEAQFKQSLAASRGPQSGT